MTKFQAPDGDVVPTLDPIAILANPRFANSRRAYVDSILGLYEYDPFINRLLLEAGRSVIFYVILCLHAAYEEGDRSTWPTMSRLQDSVAIYGVTSMRRIHDIVARLVETGYLGATSVAADRRVRILTPTQKMLAHDQDWLAAHYAPLHVMFPDPGYGPPMRRDPDFQRAHRVAGNQMFVYAARLMMANSAVMLFMGREAGMMVLIKLMQLADAGSRPLSFADLGGRFGVSRTHVRLMLQDAERAGLLQLSDRTVVLRPALHAAFDRFIADCMAGNDKLFEIATRHLKDRQSAGDRIRA